MSYQLAAIGASAVAVPSSVVNSPTPSPPPNSGPADVIPTDVTPGIARSCSSMRVKTADALRASGYVPDDT
jgi:hypothetical protein